MAPTPPFFSLAFMFDVVCVLLIYRFNLFKVSLPEAQTNNTCLACVTSLTFAAIDKTQKHLYEFIHAVSFVSLLSLNGHFLSRFARHGSSRHCALLQFY